MTDATTEGSTRAMMQADVDEEPSQEDSLVQSPFKVPIRMDDMGTTRVEVSIIKCLAVCPVADDVSVAIGVWKP